MLSAAHTLISLPLAVHLQNPLIIFVLAFLLHFILDAILHWNIYPPKYSSYPYTPIITDVFGGAFLAWLLVGNNIFTLPFLAAILGNNLPDILHSLWDISSSKYKAVWPRVVLRLFSFHDKIQVETKSPLLGLLPQIILIFFALVLVFT